MNNNFNTIRIIKRRPLVLWSMSLVLLIYLVIDKYNPIMPILLGLGKATGGNVFESLVSFLQLMIDPIILPYVLVAILGVSLIASLILGLFLAGYFNVLNNGISNDKRVKGEFLSGVKTNSLKTIFVTLRIVFLGLLLLLFMAIASVPALVLARITAEGKSGFHISSILIGAITGFVLYFLFMFFRTYFLFWYPATIQKVKKPFLTARKFVNVYFWRISGGFIIYDLVLVASVLALGKIKNGFLIFIARWLFLTIFSVSYCSYIFYTYKKYGKEQISQ